MGYVQLLAENEFSTLLVISFLGLAIGQTKIFGLELGVAAVLFVGLILVIIEPEIQIFPLIYIAGLALSVYTIGLEAGSESSSSLRSRGIKHNLFGISVFAVVTIKSLLLIKFLPIDPVEGIGVFTGALTNTPAMAAVVDALLSLISDRGEPVAAHDTSAIGYSLAYLIGVLAVIASIGIISKAFRVNHDQEAIDADVAAPSLHTRDIKVLRGDLPFITGLLSRFGLDIAVSRTEYKGHFYIPSSGDTVPVGDIVPVVGMEEKIARASECIGELMPSDPTHDGHLGFRRILVSASDMVDIPIMEPQTRMDGVTITRIRRGDHDIVAEPNIRLGLGDRICMVATSEKIKDATKFFDDSYEKLSDVNLLPLTLGFTLGVLVGLVKIPLPDGSSLALGSAGGPLVVALISGVAGRTGSLIWPIPHSADLVFCTMGLALFLAGIGTTAGKGFQATLSDPASLIVLGLVVIIAFSSVLLILIVGHQVLKIPFGQAAGILSGL